MFDCVGVFCVLWCFRVLAGAVFICVLCGGGVVCFLFCFVCCVCCVCLCFVCLFCVCFCSAASKAARHSCHLTPAVACMGLLQAVVQQPAKRRDSRLGWQLEQPPTAVLAVFVLFCFAPSCSAACLTAWVCFACSGVFGCLLVLFLFVCCVVVVSSVSCFVWCVVCVVCVCVVCVCFFVSVFVQQQAKQHDTAAI